MPPVRTGIAVCSAELVAALRDEHEIDVYVDEPLAGLAAPVPRTGVAPAAGCVAPAAGTPLRSAHLFVPTHLRRPYDLTVFQLGNSSHHDYMWAYLFKYPGLAVLHDAHLHHARAAALLRELRANDYRAEFAASEPGVNPDAAELAVRGLDSFLYYEWKFTRLVVVASRMTAVHSAVTRHELGEKFPEAAVEHIRLSQGIPLTPSANKLRGERARARHGMAPEAVVFGCFGGLTPEKRVPQVLDAFQALLAYTPSARLLLAGAAAEHYDVAADVAVRGLDTHVVLTGYLNDEEDLTDCIAATDVALTLRWPTAREVSGPWLRCLAAAKPTIVMDLVHAAGVPSLDPRTRAPNLDALHPRAPVCVAIDILDEDHSLLLAMRRLATDAGLRAALGDAAQRYWLSEHSQAAMVEDYRRVLSAAARTKAPAPELPAHLTDDGSRLMENILGALGVSVPWSKI
jgi:glycosyltransferase involved in cell wall biosynthesis